MNKLTTSHTFSGIAFDFSEPTLDMIDLSDLTQALFRIPRFNGHLKKDWDWTVGHHSLLVMFLLKESKAEGLFHDLSEGITGDCPGPLKKLLGEPYKIIERKIETLIAQKYNLIYPWPKIIKQADLLAQDIEASLMHSFGSPIVSDGFKLTQEHCDLVSKIKPCTYENFIYLAQNLVKQNKITDFDKKTLKNVKSSNSNEINYKTFISDENDQDHTLLKLKVL